MNSHINVPRNVNTPGKSTKANQSGNESPVTKPNVSQPTTSSQTPERRAIKCFRCHQFGHRIADCKVNVPYNTSKNAAPSKKT